MAEKNQSFDPGLTQQFSGEIRRAINKDGSFNVRRKGAPLASVNPYLFLVDTSWPRFILLVLCAYLLVNLIFAGIFLATGIDNLVGEGVNTGVGPFGSAFFFSVHTLTTVGYGSVYPRGIAANSVAAIEAMIGLMGFALATGLLYGRFSRPTARIIFSDAILVAPYQGITALLFRIANERANNLMDLEAKLIFMTVQIDHGTLRRQYAELALERNKVNFFPLTWTIVHPIDPASPLYGKNAEDLAKLEAEILILVKGFDETFSQVVNTRFSYRHDEIEWGAQFTPAFRVDPKGGLVLELNRINDRVPVSLPAAPQAASAPLGASSTGRD